MQDKYGLRVVKYLFAGRESAYTYPDAIEIMKVAILFKCSLPILTLFSTEGRRQREQQEGDGSPQVRTSRKHRASCPEVAGEPFAVRPLHPSHHHHLHLPPQPPACQVRICSVHAHSGTHFLTNFHFQPANNYLMCGHSWLRRPVNLSYR